MLRSRHQVAVTQASEQVVDRLEAHQHAEFAFEDLPDIGTTIGEGEVVVKFQKRAHNPLLVAVDFDKTDVKVPWLGDKRLRFVFG
jgi:hypothetical protein